MASFMCVPALGKALRNTGIDFDTDSYKMGLSTSVHVPAKDDIFCNDGEADDFNDGELNVSGYTRGFNGAGRKALVNRVVTDDLTNFRVKLDADDILWTTLGAGETIEQATLIKEVSVDTDSPVVANLDFTGVATSGNNFTLQFHTDGIIYCTC